MHKLLITAAITSLMIGCSTSPTGRSQLMLVSPQSAIASSETAYLSTVTELDSNKQLITDSAWVKRIQTITGRLVTEAVAMHPETKDWKWSVAIINDPNTLNAW